MAGHERLVTLDIRNGTTGKCLSLYIKAVPFICSLGEFLPTLLLLSCGHLEFLPFSPYCFCLPPPIILSITFASLNFRAGSLENRQILPTTPPFLAPSLASKSAKPVTVTIYPRYQEFKCS